MFGHKGEANTPLADCAVWAVRDLARKLKYPCQDSSEIVEQIVFTAKALKAYRTEVKGNISADFVSRALEPIPEVQVLESSIEELLASATAVAAVEEDDRDPYDEVSILSKAGAWLASACLRRSDRIWMHRPSRPQPTCSGQRIQRSASAELDRA